jgi:hypothetical protein
MSDVLSCACDAFHKLGAAIDYVVDPGDHIPLMRPGRHPKEPPSYHGLMNDRWQVETNALPE